SKNIAEFYRDKLARGEAEYNGQKFDITKPQSQLDLENKVVDDFFSFFPEWEERRGTTAKSLIRQVVEGEKKPDAKSLAEGRFHTQEYLDSHPEVYGEGSFY